MAKVNDSMENWLVKVNLQGIAESLARESNELLHFLEGDLNLDSENVRILLAESYIRDAYYGIQQAIKNINFINSKIS